MRRGISPAKRAGLPAHTPAEVGIVSLVFVPSLTGFYAQALEVLDLHLHSLRNTLPEGEILVWDNGSCEEVVHFLEERFQEGKVDYLWLSQYNLGKAGVLNWVLQALPHRYIAFTDGDIFFLEGWWEAVQQVFRAFPRAGMVTPAPAFFDVLRGKSRMSHLVREAGLQIAKKIPDYRELYLYYRGLGYEIPEAPEPLPFIVAPDGTAAYIRSGHHMFVMPREVAHKVPPLPVNRALSSQSDRVLHERVESQGYWQLSTTRAFIYHMGNTPSLPSSLEAEIPSLTNRLLKKTHQESAKRSTQGLKYWLRRKLQLALRHSPSLRRKFERVYDALFRLLYGEI